MNIGRLARIIRMRHFIDQDIRREIALARCSDTKEGRDALVALGIRPGGANFMCALALLSYAEFVARVEQDDFNTQGKSRKLFKDFFELIGVTSESDLNTLWVYFRNTFSHQYATDFGKDSVEVKMIKEPGDTLYSKHGEVHRLNIEMFFEALIYQLDQSIAKHDSTYTISSTPPTP